jgi:5-methylthioribose kinase
MLSIKNRIIQSLIKNSFIKSKKDILSIKHINTGLINYVFSIKISNKSLIAKYATDYCRSTPEIKIDKKRLEKEFQAINLWGSLVKKHLPKIEFYDKENNVLVFEKIPDTYSLLDNDIFKGKVNKNLPKKLGTFLANLHNSTTYNKDIQIKFRDNEMLKNFKIPVMYENLTKDTLLKRKINVLEKQLLNNKICLVQGDFKPNNIFYTKNHFYLIDYEQTHYGDPALDVCYTPAMYLLAMTNNPSKANEYYESIELFWSNYKKNSKFKNLDKLEENSLKHLGVIILSRTFGITKLGTLQKPKIRQYIRNLSKKLILGDISSFDKLSD